MSKASLVRKIMKALKKLPKAKLAKLCFELEKQLPNPLPLVPDEIRENGLEVLLAELEVVQKK